MAEIDVNQELKKIENALRDIISFSMNIKYGPNWIDQLMINKTKIADWKNKMNEEIKKYRGTKIENRLIYYSEFYDLCNIIGKHWDDIFKDIFIEKKQIEVLLDIISANRISIAHNRELREYQKSFLIGASGMIRHMITEYKADRDNEESYYPKFESIFINDIDILRVEERIEIYDKKYHVGDEIEVVVNVNCPPDVDVKYVISIGDESFHVFSDKEFSKNNRAKYVLKKKDISSVNIVVVVKSNQEYHKYKSFDLKEECSISVLPNK